MLMYSYECAPQFPPNAKPRKFRSRFPHSSECHPVCGDLQPERNVELHLQLAYPDAGSSTFPIESHESPHHVRGNRTDCLAAWPCHRTPLGLRPLQVVAGTFNPPSHVRLQRQLPLFVPAPTFAHANCLDPPAHHIA